MEKNKGEVVSNESPGRRSIRRRAFLQTGAIGLAGAALAKIAGGGTVAAQESAKRSRLVVARHPDATNDEGAGKPDIVKLMVDRAVCELAGKDSVAEAWGAFIKPSDVVGIKVNSANAGTVSAQPCVVAAIVSGLVAAGVKENSIIVWDRSSRFLTEAGFTLNDSPQGVRCYGTDRGGKAPGKNAPSPFYESSGVAVADKQVFFSKILTTEITALINVPVVKDHIIAGVTCALKNNYGTIANPKDLHKNCCDPYVAALNASAPLKEKTRLVMLDGLAALYNGGPPGKPEWRWRLNSIIASCDPVAVDAWALRVLEEKRAEKGLSPIGERARHVATAAKMGVGINDLSRVDIIEKTLG